MVDGEHDETPPRALRPGRRDQQQRRGIAATGQSHGDRARMVGLESTVENCPDRLFEAEARGCAGVGYSHFAWAWTAAARRVTDGGALG